MQVSNPIWLWGFAGLLIPIAIHLLSRKEGKVIRIGSTRFLTESATAKFSHIKLNELTLLALRCLAIALLVLLLAGLRIDEPFKQKPRWVLLERDLLGAPALATITDSLQHQGFELRLLTRGFPFISDTARASLTDDSYWALMHSLRSRPVDSVVVFSNNYVRLFGGSRIDLPDNVHWVSIEPAARKFVASSTATTNSLWERLGHSDARLTSFETRIVDGAQNADAARAREIGVDIFADPEFAYDKKVIRASLEAIQSVSPHSLTVAETDLAQTDTTRWLIWLSHKEFQSHNENKTIAYRDCVAENIPLLSTNEGTFVCEGQRNARWIISKRLNEEIAVAEKLTIALASVILPPLAVDDKNDVRVMPEKMAWSADAVRERPETTDGDRAPANRMLILLLVFTLFVERGLSFKRRQ